MARRWRIAFEGACHPVLARVNEKREIVADNEHRRRLPAHLGEKALRFDLTVFAHGIKTYH